jgi:hypothetical protein
MPSTHAPRLIVALVVVGAATLAGFAVAGDGPSGSRSAADAAHAAAAAECPAMAGMDAAVQKFRSADADGDGALSRDELAGTMPHLAERFATLDLDGDGRLTSFEIHHEGHAEGGAQPTRTTFETKTIAL